MDELVRVDMGPFASDVEVEVDKVARILPNPVCVYVLFVPLRVPRTIVEARDHLRSDQAVDAPRLSRAEDAQAELMVAKGVVAIERRDERARKPARHAHQLEASARHRPLLVSLGIEPAVARPLAWLPAVGLAADQLGASLTMNGQVPHRRRVLGVAEQVHSEQIRLSLLGSV